MFKSVFTELTYVYEHSRIKMPTLITEQNEKNTKTQELGANAALSREFSVGEWRVLPQLNRIRLNGTVEDRQLEPRLVKLLCYLAANEERVLSREELVQELWPRVLVNENSLTRAISELRRKLQSQDSSAPDYIETIPKRGYRLLPSIELREPEVIASSPSKFLSWVFFFTTPSLSYATAAAAACLCLLIAGWVSMEDTDVIKRGFDKVNFTALLSDGLLDNKLDYLGGKLQLGTFDRSPSSIATPILSLDEKQYAFIQYDTSGSTIFLGGLGTTIEPTPVYYSSQHLFNLAWSPVGNNLLFAMKPSIRSAAVFLTASETAELVTLNLNTLETGRLTEEIDPPNSSSPNSLNLT